MKFKDLSPTQKHFLTAWMNGETLEFRNGYGEWYPLEGMYFNLGSLNQNNIRIKPKEPKVTYKFTPVFHDGSISYKVYDSIYDIDALLTENYLRGYVVASYIVRTYSDDVFVKIEVLNKVELQLRGLM